MTPLTRDKHPRMFPAAIDALWGFFFKPNYISDKQNLDSDVPMNVRVIYTFSHCQGRL